MEWKRNFLSHISIVFYMEKKDYKDLFLFKIKIVSHHIFNFLN